jgi:hypothetical protein
VVTRLVDHDAKKAPLPEEKKIKVPIENENADRRATAEARLESQYRAFKAQLTIARIEELTRRQTPAKAVFQRLVEQPLAYDARQSPPPHAVGTIQNAGSFQGIGGVGGIDGIGGGGIGGLNGIGGNVGGF